MARDLGVWEDPLIRDELVQRYIESRAIRSTNLRARARRQAGNPGAEGSITKLYQAVHNRRLQDTATAVLGMRAVAWEGTDGVAADAVRGLLRAQANTIEGGTSNIQRNILGERVLGLPKEPGPPADTPWSELRRNG
jgi:alkylation response protein AidB-like acyl-CoA dehydrogenase